MIFCRRRHQFLQAKIFCEPAGRNIKMEKLLDIVELSEMLGVTKSTIYSWTSRNKIPHIKLSKRLLKFREEDILSWIAERSVSVEATRQKQEVRKYENKKSGINSNDESIERIVRNAREKILS
jgi:excisionase family DNA binding protein